MQHTVIGLFDTYPQAESARDTLVQTGFARDKIELQASPEPTVGSATGEVANAGVLANLERFFTSLFSTGSRSADTARYAEAMRRGAVLLCVHAVSESHAELARNTLVRLGATDIGDRLPEMDTEPAGSRDHSILDELGIGAVMPGTPHTSSATSGGVASASGRTGAVGSGAGVGVGAATGVSGVTGATAASGVTGAASAAGAAGAAGSTGIAGATGAASVTGTLPVDTTRPLATPATDPLAVDPLTVDPLTGLAPLPANTEAESFVPPPKDQRPGIDPLNEPVVDPLIDDVGRSALAAGAVPGSGAVMQPSEIVSGSAQPTAGLGGQMPNEYLEYEEDFRAHYDDEYASADARYEDYVPAYRYGAEIGRDARFHDRPWEEIEPEARRHWEATSPDTTWERFKVAVRHGWERVTGHHHV
ncbi:hypothetical protein BTH42_09950 [Burkholderia sp. SRS-W-2-2016]|uniref:hypothetical protein n=1 Tax=Burkholderia sp. SRS-W-2-2016 TaxID=1926878 RepID=UPI00094AD7C2|nr:hypothetical protein [Burkholderia sp. SRS-W-2-2016]OLL31942.1 hypothetical protein BTH42_09950 [Burkholderia sp. SRS-W-2-2016]